MSIYKMTYSDEMYKKMRKAIELVHRDLLDEDYSLLSIDTMNAVASVMVMREESDKDNSDIIAS